MFTEWIVSFSTEHTLSNLLDSCLLAMAILDWECLRVMDRCRDKESSRERFLACLRLIDILPLGLNSCQIGRVAGILIKVWRF